MLVAPDGKILAGGYFRKRDGNEDFAIARLMANGDTHTFQLVNGTGSPIVTLKAKTSVLNDAGDDDKLTGGASNDWYLKATDDLISDLFSGEVTDVL